MLYSGLSNVPGLDPLSLSNVPGFDPLSLFHGVPGLDSISVFIPNGTSSKVGMDSFSGNVMVCSGFFGALKDDINMSYYQFYTQKVLPEISMVY